MWILSLIFFFFFYDKGSVVQGEQTSAIQLFLLQFYSKKVNLSLLGKLTCNVLLAKQILYGI